MGNEPNRLIEFYEDIKTNKFFAEIIDLNSKKAISKVPEEAISVEMMSTTQKAQELMSARLENRSVQYDADKSFENLEPGVGKAILESVNRENGRRVEITSSGQPFGVEKVVQLKIFDPR